MSSVRPFIKIFNRLNNRWANRSNICKCLQLQKNRAVSTASLIHAKKMPTQYEYDPQTDTFRPKSMNQSESSTYNGKQSYSNKNNQNSNNNYKSFIKRFLRNLFLITGGVVWTGVVIVTLFVDVNESEIEVRLHDVEDHVRAIAFYDVIPRKGKGFSQLLQGKDATLSDIQLPEMKEKVFHEALQYVKQNQEINEYLGKPVLFCGFLAANKVNDLLNRYNDITKYGYNATKNGDSISEVLNDEGETTKQWKAECILEAPQGLALLTLDFECYTSVGDNQWKLKRVEVQKLSAEKQNIFLEENRNGIRLK